jgi:hypothetical protein
MSSLHDTIAISFCIFQYFSLQDSTVNTWTLVTLQSLLHNFNEDQMLQAHELCTTVTKSA